MPPVRARPITGETFSELLRRTSARRSLQDPTVIQPCLEVIGRGLNHDGRLEAVRPHSLDGISGKVIDGAKHVRPRWPDIDMRSLGVLVAESFDRRLDLDSALAFPEDHLAGIAPDAKIKALAAHRPQLGARQPFNNHSGFFAALFALGFGHHRRSRGRAVRTRPRYILGMEPLRSPPAPRLRLRPAPRVAVRGTVPGALRSPRAGACRRRFCPQILASATGLQHKLAV